MRRYVNLICIAFLVYPVWAQQDSVRTIRSVPTNSPVIDGILEAEWQQAPAATDFIQRDPTEGAPASQKTEVRVMNSPTALYFGIRCHETDPSKIASVLTKRDKVDGDMIMIYLDTYHDHRTGFYFTINPAGVQEDGILYNDNWTDNSWDGNWQVETTRDDSGWTAEVKIPFNTLRFRDDAGEQTWGINFQKYTQRDKEGAFWQPVTRDKGRRVSGFGHLIGLSSLKPGQGLELRPYGVANFQETGLDPLHGNNDWNNLGIDAKFRLSPNLTLDATYNPDFAQIEADEEVINLSDYPEYLLEKRPFFLEGANVFDMQWDLFYSRRITNPEGGAKVSGKIGGMRMMALAARNLNEENQKENFGILRLKRDIFKDSELGLLMTDKEGPDSDYGRLWAVDSRIKFNDQFSVQTILSQSFKPDLLDDNWAYRVYGLYTSDRYSGELYHESMTRDFRANDTGWTSYSDFHREGGWAQYASRPEKWGIRRISNNVNFGTETHYNFTDREWWGNYNNSFTTMNYMYFGFGVAWSKVFRRKYVDDGEFYQNHDNFGNYNLECYQGSDQWIWYESDFSKPLALAVSYEEGDFRNGYNRELDATLQVRPLHSLDLRLVNEFNRVQGVYDVNDGALSDFMVTRFRAEWTLSRRLFTRLTTQYVKDEKVYLSNALFGYNFAPESYLYLVYDDSRSELLGWKSIQDRIIKMKISYFVQI
ncbi:MAG: DUF5916 domain-containing protein [bacterium]|nr:DUF5916 domain-containing protein [bacterium]